jgi:hypothetical protein
MATTYRYIPNGHKIRSQTSSNRKTLQNFPKSRFCIWKYASGNPASNLLVYCPRLAQHPSKWLTTLPIRYNSYLGRGDPISAATFRLPDTSLKKSSALTPPRPPPPPKKKDSIPSADSASVPRNLNCDILKLLQASAYYNRVTRLTELLPIGRLFTRGN